MPNLKKYYLWKAGAIPGFPGLFPGGFVVTIDEDTNALVSQEPLPGITVTPAPEPALPVAEVEVPASSSEPAPTPPAIIVPFTTIELGG